MGSLQPSRESISTWLVWMVHRVELNDPSLKEMDLSYTRLPTALDEPRVVPKLLKALARNEHLQKLIMTQCSLHGGEQAKVLAHSLARNRSLQILDIGANNLNNWDLQTVVGALGENRILCELHCARQLGGEAPDRYTLQAVTNALAENRTIRKLGMDLVDPHGRDQITRALVRNVEHQRQQRRIAARGVRNPAW